MPQELKEKIIKASQEKPCNHFMVWNIQGGYSYYRCDKCNYIDGEKTFEEEKQKWAEEIKELKKGTSLMYVGDNLAIVKRNGWNEAIEKVINLLNK